MKPLLFAQIYKDRFITFGGLISSRIVVRELEKVSNVYHELSFESLKPFFSGRGKEPQIQKQLEQWLDYFKRYGLKFKPYDFKRDILISEPQKIIVEIKHNHYETPEPLDNLKGSPAPLSAVQQLFKYLLLSEPNIGILTDGMSFRFYYSTIKKPHLLEKNLVKELSNFSFEPYLEFSLNDIIAAKSKPHYDFFLRLLLQPDYLRKLVAETSKGQASITKKVFSELEVCLKESIENNFDDFSSTVIFTATMGAIRVLEDHGVFEIHPETHRGKGYKAVSLQGPFNETLLRQSISAFLSGKFLKIEGRDFGSILDYNGNIKLDINNTIEELLTSSRSKKTLKKIYEIIVKADCSDLDWNFWSILYQLNANREDKNARFGKYYTHPEITADIVEWFVHREQRATQDLKNLPIYDPCVGSGNMLRTFLSFAQRLEPAFDSPIEAACHLAKNRLWGSDIDLCALWICKLSLSTALASRYRPMPIPRIFHMDVFDNDGWSSITRGQKNKKFSIVTNPPWKRPKFQLNYAFRDFFGLSKLPKVGSDLYKPYEEFKRIITFGRRSTAQYYKDWDLLLTRPGSLPLDQRKHFQTFEAKLTEWIDKYKSFKASSGEVNLKNVLSFLQGQRDDVAEQKKKFSESFSSSAADTPDVVLKDKSCAAMFFSRMVRGIASGSKFAIVQPDSFFIGDTAERRMYLNLIEKYFCFSKNRIPGTQKPLFSEVHTGMKFGVVLGTKGSKKSSIKAVVFKTDLTEDEFRKRSENDEIEVEEFVVDKVIYKRQNFGMLPLFDTEQAFASLVAWLKGNKPCISKLRWHAGIDQSSSRNWTTGKRFLLASSKNLIPKTKNYIFSFMSQNKHQSKYERRNLRPATIASQKIPSVRVFVADVNRNTPQRHSCLVAGLIPSGQAVFNNILWCAPRNPKKVLTKIASSKFEKALYVISKSNHINALALNWLGFKS